MATAIEAAQAKIVGHKPDWEVVCGLSQEVGGFPAGEGYDYHHYVPLILPVAWQLRSNSLSCSLLTYDLINLMCTNEWPYENN